MRAYSSVAHLKLILSELSACILLLLLINFPKNQESDTKQHRGIYSHHRRETLNKNTENAILPLHHAVTSEPSPWLLHRTMQRYSVYCLRQQAKKTLEFQFTGKN